MSPSHTFLQQFIAGLLLDATSNPTANVDDIRFGTGDGEIAGRRRRETLLRIASRLGWFRRRYNPRHVERALSDILPHLSGLERSHQRWQDDASRQLMVELMRYRVLGPEHVALSTNHPDYWGARDRVAAEFLREKACVRVGECVLDRYELPGTEAPISSTQRIIGATTTFLLEQYALRRSGVKIEASPGDVVLDAGGCWGDTALYFADRVGTEGKVYAFEFDPANLEIFRRNQSANPRLASRIDIVEHPLWSTSGTTIDFVPAGPSTTVQVGGAGAAKASTLSIDDFVSQRGINRVDFLKMDIEGAEVPALEGARETLLRFRPKLAICAYHKVDDFVSIADFIDGLGCGYRQWLAHHTIHLEESVIFAQAC